MMWNKNWTREEDRVQTAHQWLQQESLVEVKRCNHING
jgi:hypothetical protein